MKTFNLTKWTALTLAITVLMTAPILRAQELVLEDEGYYNTLIDSGSYTSVRITGGTPDNMFSDTTTLTNSSNSYTGGTTVDGGWAGMSSHWEATSGSNSNIGTGNLTLDGGGLRGTQGWTTRFNNRTLTVNSASYLGDRLQIGSGQVTGTLVGSGSLTKVGSGATTSINNANTGFTGEVIVQEGLLLVNSPHNTTDEKTDVLGGDIGHGGSTQGGNVTIMDGATLSVGGGNSGTTINNDVYVTGTGYDGNGALINFNRGGEVTGTVTLTGDTKLGNAGAYGLILSGGIADDGTAHTLTLYGMLDSSGLRLEGAGTFTGDVIIDRGLVKHINVAAFGADLANKSVTVNAYDDGTTDETTQLHMYTNDITVGTLNLNLLAESGNTATIQRSGSGAIRANTIVLQSGEFAALSDTSGYDWATTGDKTLVIDSTPTFSRSLGLTSATDTLEVRSNEFTAERGTGIGQLGDASNVPLITVTGGTLTINDDLSAGMSLTVADGGTVKGTGTLPGSATIQNGGTLSPGASPGIINAGDLTIEDGGSILMEI